MKGRDNLLYLISILGAIAAYLININNLSIVSMAIMMVGIILSIIDIKKGLIFFFIASLVFSDYTFEGVMGEDESASFGGIYMTSLAGGTLMVYWALVNFILLFIKKGKWAVNTIKTQPLLKILIVTVFFSIIGFLYNVTTTAHLVIQTAVSDIRIYVNVFLGFLTVMFIVRNSHDLRKYFNVFVLVLTTQICITITSSYLVSQVQTIYTFYSGTETYLLSIPFLYFIFLTKGRNVGKKFTVSPLYLIGGMLIIVLFIFIVPSRGRIFALAFPVLLYLFYSKKWKYVVLFPILVISAIYLVQIINPNFYNYFVWKFTTFNPNAEGAESSRMRYVELINILGELGSNLYYFFFGKGFGGSFQTSFVNFDGFTMGRGSFPSVWIAEGRFYKPHGTWLYFLLKYGIVMTLILYYHIGRLFYRSWIILKRTSQSIYKLIGLCFLFNLPGLSIIMFSSKLQILFGLLIGFLYLAVYFATHTKSRKLVINKQPSINAQR